MLTHRVGPIVTLIVVVVALGGCLRDGGQAATPITEISMTSLPAAGRSGSTVPVCWHLSGNGTATATGLITNTSAPSQPEFTGPHLYPDNASAPTPVHVPGTFCTGVTLPSSGVLWVSPFAYFSGGGLAGGAYMINVT